jgi:hypothetical protein
MTNTPVLKAAPLFRRKRQRMETVDSDDELVYVDPVCTTIAQSVTGIYRADMTSALCVRSPQVLLPAPTPVDASALQEWQVFNMALHIFSSVLNLDMLDHNDYSDICAAAGPMEFGPCESGPPLKAKRRFPQELEDSRASNVEPAYLATPLVSEGKVEEVSLELAREPTTMLGRSCKQYSRVSENLEMKN